MFTTLEGKPYYCLYWLTYKCNSKCGYCNIWQIPSLRNTSDVKFSDAEKNLYDLKKIGVKIIDFTGGEPLLNKDLPQILSYAKELGFFVKLSSNGLLYPDKAKELKGVVDRIYFSLDTTSKIEYEKIRGIDGFDKIIESIIIAKQLKQKIYLLHTVTDETVNHIQDVINFCKQYKLVQIIHPCFSYFNNKSLDKKNIKKITKYFFHPYVRMSLPYLDFYYNGGNSLKHPKCKAGISTIDISPENCLTIPCFLRNIKKVRINGNLYSLYTSPEWKKLFANVGRYSFCNNCTSECYFGLTYWNRLNLGHYFIKENLTMLKDTIEALRG